MPHYYRISHDDGIVRAGRQASHTAVAEVAVNERRLSGVYGDDGLGPARLTRHALATRLAQIVVYAGNFGRQWVIGHISTLFLRLRMLFQKPLRLYRRDRARTGRYHHLAIEWVLHIPGHKDARHIRSLALIRDNVPLLIQLQLPGE